MMILMMMMVDDDGTDYNDGSSISYLMFTTFIYHYLLNN